MRGSGRPKLVLLIEFLILTALGIFLYDMQIRLSTDSMREDMSQGIERVEAYLETIGESTESVTKDYDAVYQSKARTLAYMVQNKINGKLSDARLLEYAGILGVERAYIIDAAGEKLFQTAETEADFTFTRYAMLRNCFRAETVSEAFNVEIAGERRRYYGAKIDDRKMAVLEIAGNELEERVEAVSSWEAILENIDAGLDGFFFAISKKDYTFLYYPGEGMTGADAILAGVPMAQLKDGSDGFFMINGESCYCTVLETEEAYVLCAVWFSKLTASCRVTVALVLFVIFIVFAILTAYYIFVSEEEQRLGRTERKTFFIFRFHSKLARKMAAFSIVGVCCIFVIAWYMQTLFLYSKYSMSCNRHVLGVEKTISQHEREMGEQKGRNDEIYLDKCRTAAYILQSKPQLASRRGLDRLCDVLGVNYIYLFGEDGAAKVTNAPYTKFRLSDDPESQSYAFRELLQGEEYLVQEARTDDMGNEMQYVGVSVRDEEGIVREIVQIGIFSEKPEEKAADRGISSILNEISVGEGGFAFAVGRSDSAIVYFPEKKYIGCDAAECGIQKSMLKDGFNGFLTVNDVEYYGSALETEDYYLYAVVPKSEMNGTQLPVAAVSTLAAFISLAVIGMLMLAGGRKEVLDDEEEQEGTEPSLISFDERKIRTDENEQMVNVIMPDGSIKKTESAVSRWDNMSVEWKNRTAEQKVLSLLKALVMLLDAAIASAVLFGRQIFEENSIFSYIINGNWERGINIFAVTASIITICMISAVVELAKAALRAMSRAMTARGETICRLLGSALKYLSILLTVYCCLTQIGVETQTLLASAGILSLVVGLGAKDMITDILAGLFIIFEGEFQVGDIVTIGDWRGTVLEIGMRTTKLIKEGNIKIINNSNIRDVVNMTRRVSYVICEVKLAYTEDLEQVEAILARELPLVKKRIPEIADGPFYKGVSLLGEDAIHLAIMAQCTEEARIELVRKLNREIKLLFDRNNIHIPYPQIVVNYPQAGSAQKVNLKKKLY